RGSRGFAYPAAARRDDAPRLGREDEPVRGGGGGGAARRHRCAGGGRDPARRLRLARRAGHPGHPGRRPDALQQAARAYGQASPREDRRRRAPRSLPRLTMATPVYMEALSPTMEEGRLVKWHKRDGDAVKAGDTLAEVGTDKAVMDLVARADGVLRQIAVAEGQTVPVGKEIAAIVAPGEAVATPQGRGTGDERPVVTAPTPTAPARTVAVAAPAAVADATRVKASPLAKRIARETGLDLKQVTGSGPGGRVVRKDLEVAAAAPLPASAAPTPVAPVPRPPSPIPVSRTGAPYEDAPLTQIRKTIAKRLATSLGPIPHYFLTTEVDMERDAEARAPLNQALGTEGKISFNDVILKATALALKQHRACNAWFADDHIS